MVDKDFLKEKAKEIRCKSLTMLTEAGTGHPGGSMSEIELLVALYYSKLNIDPKRHDWEKRDRFVLSKGHANPPLYAILADLGFFEEKYLWTLRKLGSKLQGHPDMNKVPGIEFSTGSLGQGYSAAVGMAIAAKLKGESYKIYALTGDGEQQEGIIWEASMTAAHYKLDNFVAIVDFNGLQIDGQVDDVMSLGDLKAKYMAFGFAVKEIDGHDFDEIFSALEYKEKDKPLCIIAKTIKGKSVSFMENEASWHGQAPSREQLEKAIMDIKGC